MSPQRYIFRRQRRWYSSPAYIFVLLTLILGGLFITQGYRRDEISPLFMATPTPTRIPRSFALEAETHFQAGDLDAAIASYQQAIENDPQNGLIYAELARILTYSTQTQTTADEKQERYELALEAANKAVEVSPEDSMAFAIQAFTLNWYADFYSVILQDDSKGDELLADAEQSIFRALTLDETNNLAKVYFAEIMIDQQRWDQADAAIRGALERDPKDWEAHRVYGLFLENQGYYEEAIAAFEEAVRLAPNMTFIYIKLGQSNRSLGMRTNSSAFYNASLDYFAKAAELNEQLNIQDPLPYLGIGRVYAQMGEGLAASRNMNKALQINPYSPDVYAQLGMVYRQARNYEDAIKSLKCSVRGCDSDETCEIRSCNKDTDPAIEIEGMELSGQTVVYYYTYASLLAGMYLPRHPERSLYCTQATEVIAEIKRSSYGTDQLILDILAPSESICASARADSLATPTPSPTPSTTLTTTPTPASAP